MDNFYTAPLATGAPDEGVPRLRDVRPHFFAAYVLDPDGHQLMVAYHRADA